MRFGTPLVPAVLIRRYKRFLADARLADGHEITAHCANPGSMMGLAKPGMRIWLEPNDDPKKKLKYGWRLVELQGGEFVGVDTSVPNRALKEALTARQVAGLPAYETLRAEVKYGENSRVDFVLDAADGTECFLEVKSVTLSRQTGVAEFPDSVTARGTKHLEELAKVCEQGGKAMMLYLVQRTDATRVTLAEDIDPNYAAAFRRARAAGVGVVCIGTKISPDGIETGAPLPFEFD